MRVISLYRHGFTLGTPPKMPNRTPVKRGTVSGWSESASRRNMTFLRSVDERTLPTDANGIPLLALALTLTVKICPETPEKWHSIRRSFLKRLERMGLYRSHWVTEWQKRGVPHLHGAFWIPDPLAAFPEGEKRIQYQIQIANIIDHWLDLTADYGSLRYGQKMLQIHDAVGWFQYLSKHASRGVSHYQRSPENIPPEWKSKTGRIWGKTGHWVTQEKIQLSIEDPGFFMLRRLARSWRVADSRKSGNLKRIAAAKKMLKHNDKDLSRLRGVSEWLDIEDALRLVEVVASMGYTVEHRESDSLPTI